MTTKITKATFKSFVRKNIDKLLIINTSSFDGMTDCVQQTGEKEFRKVTGTFDADQPYTFGVDGVWLVSGSRNYFSQYETKTHIGISVTNCCDTFTVAITK